MTGHYSCVVTVEIAPPLTRQNCIANGGWWGKFAHAQCAAGVMPISGVAERATVGVGEGVGWGEARSEEKRRSGGTATRRCAAHAHSRSLISLLIDIRYIDWKQALTSTYSYRDFYYTSAIDQSESFVSSRNVDDRSFFFIHSEDQAIYIFYAYRKQKQRDETSDVTDVRF